MSPRIKTTYIKKAFSSFFVSMITSII
jgi:hypothetical protein